jgi:serine/threonine-protein kinase/endoribonuclease IRE1
LDSKGVLNHPYFWSSNRRLSFLQDVSDRLEIESRELPGASKLLAQLEKNSFKVIGKDWTRRLDRILMDEMLIHRTYNASLIQDLLRAIRNKKHHYHGLSSEAKKGLGNSSGITLLTIAAFLSFFVEKFPNLFMHVYLFFYANFDSNDHILGSYCDSIENEI